MVFTLFKKIKTSILATLSLSVLVRGKVAHVSRKEVKYD